MFEISTVVALRDGERAWACKRLPPFADASAVARYRAVFGKYLEALDRAGVVPLECSLETVSDTSAYVLQPLLPSNALMPNHLRALDERSAVVLFREVVDKVRCVIDSGNLGIDAQLSNWCLVGGEIRYLDVTTPLLRDSAGREQLDTELFLERHDQFDRIERVGAQIVDERRVGGDLFLADAESEAPVLRWCSRPGRVPWSKAQRRKAIEAVPSVFSKASGVYVAPSHDHVAVLYVGVRVVPTKRPPSSRLLDALRQLGITDPEALCFEEARAIVGALAARAKERASIAQLQLWRARRAARCDYGHAVLRQALTRAQDALADLTLTHQGNDDDDQQNRNPGQGRRPPARAGNASGPDPA